MTPASAPSIPPRPVSSQQGGSFSENGKLLKLKIMDVVRDIEACYSNLSYREPSPSQMSRARGAALAARHRLDEALEMMEAASIQGYVSTVYIELGKRAYIHAAKGTENTVAVKSGSTPSPAQGAGQPPASARTATGMVPEENSGRGNPQKDSKAADALCPHETPAAPSNLATESQRSYLKSLNYSGTKPLAQLTVSEASDAIKRLKAGRK